ncbi:tryptophan synthase subunit alpha [Helicobacter muridarum]|uniref:tryptophan synthase n=1 Tax=Helicobacter muridarum TaxID=216 RepID=A0A377PUC0_9HELI|nr:tryptophan synthase subunit alpha [Helicobacter muridarum]TLE00073.1 tryptophan synthase subunit alpha [Helicobacter muridarum]STQ86079.1 tryptophan synthase subunit alpha [Helicobacter muridarum]
MQRLELMGHVVAGYPDMKTCLCAGTGICSGGANFLEVQFPFSDGNADGSIIQQASDYSIKHNFEPKNGFMIIRTLVKNTAKNILAMTYANIVFQYGIYEFVKELKECGAYGLIVPDFCFNQDDFGLREACLQEEIHFIEIITPITPAKRIRSIARYTNAPFVYAVARNGITGDKTKISQNVLDYIKEANEICEQESKHIMLGFGINDSNQLRILDGKIYGVVAGSYFLNIINENKDSNDLVAVMKEATRKLLDY